MHPKNSKLRHLRSMTFILTLLCAVGAAPHPPPGKAAAVGDLLDRVLPGARQHFEFSLDPAACTGITTSTTSTGAAVATKGCFTLSDSATPSTIKVVGPTASDLSAGVGMYLMEYANCTFGWPRGGGNHMVLPTTW